MSINKLNEFFEIESIGNTASNQIQKSSESDYEYARENLYDIINKSKIALEGIMKVATEGDSPRAYEVVTQMLKTMSEINKDLIDLEKIKNEANKTTIKTTNNNSFFIGSTSDLQDLINPERSKNKSIEMIDAKVVEDVKEI
jgi:hypothetical protein